MSCSTPRIVRRLRCTVSTTEDSSLPTPMPWMTTEALSLPTPMPSSSPTQRVTTEDLSLPTPAPWVTTKALSLPTPRPWVTTEDPSSPLPLPQTTTGAPLSVPSPPMTTKAPLSPTPSPLMTTGAFSLPTSTPLMTTEAPSLPLPSPLMTTGALSLPTSTPQMTTEAPSLPLPSPLMTTGALSLPTSTPQMTTEATSWHLPSPLMTTGAFSLPTSTPLMTTEAPSWHLPSPLMTTGAVSLPTSTPQMTTEAPSWPLPSTLMTTEAVSLPTSTPQMTTEALSWPLPSPLMTTGAVSLPTSTPQMTTEAPSWPLSSPLMTTGAFSLPTSTPLMTTEAPSWHLPSPLMTTGAVSLPTSTPQMTTEAPSWPLSSALMTTGAFSLPTSTPLMTTEAPSWHLPSPLMTTGAVSLPTSTPQMTTEAPSLPLSSPLMTTGAFSLPTSTPQVTIEDPTHISSTDIAIAQSPTSALRSEAPLSTSNNATTKTLSSVDQGLAADTGLPTANADPGSPSPNPGQSEDSDCSTTISYKAFKLQSNVSVQTSSAKNGKRSQKKQCCLYCETLSTKLSRHLTSKHSEEHEVAKIMILPKKSKERKKAWAEITAKGNFHHNLNVIQNGSRKLIPKYRPNEESEKKYLPCEFCKAYFVSSDLWKHHRSCPSKPQGVRSDGPVQNSRLLLPTSSSSSSSEFNKAILCKMRDDMVCTMLKSDSLIMLFGERQYEKLGHHTQNHQYIAQRLRELGRLLIAVTKRNDTLTKVHQCLSPANWETLISAVKDVAGYDPNTHSYAIPSLPLRIGHSLKKCAKILRNRSITVEDGDSKQKATDFIHLYHDEWSERISSHALETLAVAKYNTVKYLPLVEDVVKLTKYIDAKILQLTQPEQKLGIEDTYRELASASLAQFILFNRKRSGEAQHVKVESLLKASVQPNVDPEVKSSLTKFEQLLCENHIRIETQGKKGRKVAVLLTHKMKNTINILLKQRQSLGLESQYVFSKPNSNFTFRGTDVLRKLTKEAGLQHPERINSTRLRKQLATMSQLLGLSETHQDILARFMGHDIRVHRDFYRLPESTLEIAKVSKVLHALNTGNVAEIAGKDFDSIDANAELEHDSAVEESDESGDDTPISELEHDSAVEESDESGDDTPISVKKQKAVPPSKNKLVYKRLKAFSESDSDEYEPPSKKRSVGMNQPCIRRVWSSDEKKAVESSLSKFIKCGKLPGKRVCEETIKTNHALRHRTWTMIKGYVRNGFVTAQRRLSKQNKCS